LEVRELASSNDKASAYRADVLVVTALAEEFEAAKAVAQARTPDGPGIQRWVERDASGSAPFVQGTYLCPDGRRLTVALARPIGMGGRSTAPLTTALVERLRPHCLAMCGVCAGNPADTVLGDVVVADVAYEWDEGRHSASGFEGQHQQVALDPRWLRAAQDFDPTALPSYGPVDADEAMLWLLERLHRDQDPRRHPARNRYFPQGTWEQRLTQFEADGLIARGADEAVILTEPGARMIRRRLYDDVDGPQRLPFRVLVAPMASGSAVVKNAAIWPTLARMGMRKVAAVEMEAATVATVAREREVPRWIVAKGVMDHGDAHKDDRYKAFAARSSAEVLFALLARLGSGSREPARAGSAPGGPRKQRDAPRRTTPPRRSAAGRSKGLIDMAGDRLVFGETVARIADSLRPLGAAGRLVAESYAVATEMRRISLEETRAADDKEVRLALLEQRRRESSATLRQMQQELGRADASAKALRQCMVNMQSKTVEPGLLPEELLAYRDLTAHFATMVVQHHTDLTGGVALVVDKVLNGSGAAALTPAPRSPAPERPAAERPAQARPAQERPAAERPAQARDADRDRKRRR
jgi:nucleoside phosphorylase